MTTCAAVIGCHLVADPVHLLGGGDVVVAGVVLPALLAGHHRPARVPSPQPLQVHTRPAHIVLAALAEPSWTSDFFIIEFSFRLNT